MVKVLIVDDRESNLLLLESIIKREGWEAISEISPKNFIALAKQIQPDVIVMDLLLPGGISGQQLVQQMRQDGDLADIPVVAVTAAPEVAVKASALAAGCDVYLAKPFGAQVLIDAIRQLLDGD